MAAITVCVEQQSACADDLSAYANSGEQAVMFVNNVLGTLSLSNTGGAAVATITSQVYAVSGNHTEYEVFYTSAGATPTTDTLTIADSGSKSSLTIPVTLIASGTDSGPSAFALAATSGIPCPGNKMTFDTQEQGDATIVLSTSNTSVVNISQNGSGNFVLGILQPGTGYVTATAGSSTVTYPLNIPQVGFTSSC